MPSNDKSIDTSTGENENTSYDAELLKDAIAEDEAAAPETNISKDYAQSKQFSTPDHELAPEEVTPSLGSSFNPLNDASESTAEGNPENFREMAQELNVDR
ncbi:MAG TPA: hypothetical protein V6D19_22785 [Stenomitos sp.]